MLDCVTTAIQPSRAGGPEWRRGQAGALPRRQTGLPPSVFPDSPMLAFPKHVYSHSLSMYTKNLLLAWEGGMSLSEAELGSFL